MWRKYLAGHVTGARSSSAKILTRDKSLPAKEPRTFLVLDQGPSFRSQTRVLYLQRVKMDSDGPDGPGLSDITNEAEKELSRLWRTWRTVNEMLVDRVRLLYH